MICHSFFMVWRAIMSVIIILSKKDRLINEAVKGYYIT